MRPRRFAGAVAVFCAGGTLLAWPILAAPLSAAFSKAAKLKGYPFTLGVASGDPAPDGFVLWTRLAPNPLHGGGMPDDNIEVTWRVANDEGLTKIAAEGTTLARPDMAHSVHVEVGGLEPGRWYWYQFTAAGEASPLGRTRTNPAADDSPARLRLAFASCQHFEYGYYTAYQHMAEEDLDLVLHLGDYIYENSNHGHVRHHEGSKCETLADYRNRHAQYKTDPLLQRAHARFPWLVTWDDHEVENDYAGANSEVHGVTEATFLARRAVAYQAYYEHMPLRAAQIPRGPDMRLYRRSDFGTLAQLSLLDTRQYRTDQPCATIMSAPCAEAANPQATLLGDAQEAWLVEGLKASPARWNVLAQQVMMARVNRAPQIGEIYCMDQWPGYETNRQRMLRFFASGQASNPVILTGDIHSNWANDLQVSAEGESPIVASEFVGTSISSGGNGTATPRESSWMLPRNPFVKFHNSERGYVSCEVTPQKWTSHYRTVPFIDREGCPLETRCTLVLEAGRRGLQQG